MDQNVVLIKLDEISCKYNTEEISEEQLMLITNKLESLDKGSDELIKFIGEIIDSKFNKQSLGRIFSDKKYNTELKLIISKTK
jgi:hypothetical protein